MDERDHRLLQKQILVWQFLENEGMPTEVEVVPFHRMDTSWRPSV